MSETYSNEYFSACIRKHRLTISKEKDYKSVEKLFDNKDKTTAITINVIAHGKEHEQ